MEELKTLRKPTKSDDDEVKVQAYGGENCGGTGCGYNY